MAQREIMGGAVKGILKSIKIKWVDKEYGERYIVSVGRSMPKNVAGELRFMFASFMSFGRMLNMVQKEISKIMFKGNGVTIKKLKDREVIVTLKDVNIYEKSCLLWKGALLGVMDASKSSGKVELIESESATDCSFRVTWE